MRQFALLACVLVVATVGCISTTHPPQSTALFSTPQIEYREFLPEQPDDFDLIIREFFSGYIDTCLLDERYYLQPEFYVQSWANGKPRYEQHDYSRWIVHGHGAYPSNPSVMFQDPTNDSWISLCVFYHTGWGVETWQGLKLIPSNSPYFTVTITPDEMLLPPTYPQFLPGWAQKLSINISVKEVPPAGTYTITVNSGEPSLENSQKWFMQVFKQNLTRAQQIMIDECLEQAQTTDEYINCEKLIQSERRNKYVTGGILSVGSRITITIEVV